MSDHREMEYCYLKYYYLDLCVSCQFGVKS